MTIKKGYYILREGRKYKETYNLQRVIAAIEVIQGTPINTVANKYKVTSRTIKNWIATLQVKIPALT